MNTEEKEVIANNQAIITAILQDHTGRYSDDVKAIYADPGLAKDTHAEVGKRHNRTGKSIAHFCYKAGIIHEKFRNGTRGARKLHEPHWVCEQMNKWR